jgi:hypothetical protein
VAELFAWREDAMVGRLQLDDHGGKVVGEADLALQAALVELAREPYLPLTVRAEVEGRRFVRCDRLTPGEPGYWAALADALQRRTGLALTTSAQPPA